MSTFQLETKNNCSSLLHLAMTTSDVWFGQLIRFACMCTILHPMEELK